VFVRARDASGAWGAVSAAFLNVTNTPLLDANFTSSCSGLNCSFSGASSSGNPTGYSWNFGDGSTGSGASVSRSYAAAGTYNVSLTVSNGSTSNTETQPVTVTAAGSNVAEVESNNTRGTAQVVTPNPATVNGRIASTTDTDYYSVSLAPGATLTATLTPPAGVDYDLVIANTAGTTLASSSQGAGAVDTASVRNTGTTAVTRLVRVVYYSGGAANYTLRLAR
jgi:carboxypeptidase T